MNGSFAIKRRLVMAATPAVVFLLDADNTLLDNDRLLADMKGHLRRVFRDNRLDEEYWSLFEELRAEIGYADYLGALQRYRVKNPRDQLGLRISTYLLEYPFATRVYPGVFDLLRRLRAWGPTVILSDGDVVFQPRKIERSALFEAVDGHVLVYIHKEQELDDIARRYPADHYVFVDDKLRLLTAFKEAWGRRVTTVFPRQGHYATDPAEQARYPAADITVERIGDLLNYDLPALLAGATARSTLPG
jgi:FMN phosphatase YigB (HAD superfamily)